jgi:putative endonuclease
MVNRQKVGKWGESAAESYLIKQGYVLIEKNWRTSIGEIDLIVQGNDDEIVFVEVKTRQGDKFGFPEEAVNRKKRQTLVNLAYEYIREKQISYDWRIDVISIVKNRDGAVEIEWFQNAIREFE